MKSNNLYRVVIQLSNNDTFVHKSLIRQLHNIIRDLDKLSIEVVTHSYGVDFLLQTSPFKDAIQELNAQEVTFLVCENTLRQDHLDPSDLLALTKIVPSGLAHIIKRQSEGWAYIKASF